MLMTHNSTSHSSQMIRQYSCSHPSVPDKTNLRQDEGPPPITQPCKDRLLVISTYLTLHHSLSIQLGSSSITPSRTARDLDNLRSPACKNKIIRKKKKIQSFILTRYCGLININLHISLRLHRLKFSRVCDYLQTQ